MEESVRVRGTAQPQAEGRRVFRRVTLFSGKEKIASVDEGEIDLALHEGGTATIEAPAEGLTLIGGTATILREAWGDLRDRPEAAGLVRNVLAPFTPVELHLISIEPGEKIEVYGTAFEFAFAEGVATERSGASKHPSRVVAQIVAFGEQPEDAMRAMTMAIADLKKVKAEAPVAPKTPAIEDEGDPAFSFDAMDYVPLGAAALGIGGSILAAVFDDKPLDVWCMKLLTIWWVVLAVVFRPSRRVPVFYTREKPSADISFPEFGARLVLGSMPFVIAFNRFNSGFSPTTMRVLSTVFVAGWLLSVLTWERESHVLLSALVGASRLPLKGAEGLSGTCDGVVADSTPCEIAGRKAALGVVTQWKKGIGKRSEDTIESAKFHTNGGFELTTKEGAVAIDPDDCVWATTARVAPEKGTFGYTISQWIPVGGKLAACGRFLRYGGKKGAPLLRLRSVGTTPVILLATNADGDPLRLATRIVWHRRITLLGIVLAGVALAALASSNL